MSKEFIMCENKGLKYLSIPLFKKDKNLIHIFTTRCGGMSKGCYSSLNMAFHVGDDAQCVLANRRKVCSFLGINPDALVTAQQVHGDKVRVVTIADKGRGALSQEDAISGTDALVTGEPSVPLAAFFADCAAIFLFDPVKKVIALAHAGWRGTVLRIGRKTVECMRNIFGCRPADILAGISPAIGACCYEVDKPVIDALRENFSYWKDLVQQNYDQKKWRFDLREANKRTLLEAGLTLENIAVAGSCTACHSDIFFSYRKEGGRTGRMAAILMLSA